MKWRLAISAAFVAGIALRLHDLLRADALSRLDDDAFMYFDVARTLGTTGRLVTSGVQPLYALLCAPIYAFYRPESADELDRAARACLGVCSASDLAAAAFVGVLLWRVSGPLASALGVWCWAVHAATTQFGVNGLETSLALAAALATVVSFELGRRDWLTGVAVGVAMLARIDLAAIGAAIAFVTLWDARREDHPLPAIVRRGSRLAAGWATIYVPWLIFLYLQTGDLFPVSGPASHILGIDTRATFATGGDVDYSSFMLQTAVEALAFGTPIFAAAALVLSPFSSIVRFRLFLFQCVAAFVYYVGFHDVWWYLGRYLAPFLALEVLVASSGLVALLARRPAWRSATVAASVALVCFVLLNDRVLRPKTQGTPTNYYDMARSFASALPPDVRLAAPESGALGYYMHGRVVNLDGVVNRAAYEAVRANTLADYVAGLGLAIVVSQDSECGRMEAHGPGLRLRFEGLRFGAFALYSVDVSRRASTASPTQ